MSNKSNLLSFFELMYSNNDSIVEVASPLLMSPINYEDTPLFNIDSERYEYLLSITRLKAYNNLYLVGHQPTHYTDENNKEHLDLPENGVVNDAATSHPEPPWFY